MWPAPSCSGFQWEVTVRSHAVDAVEPYFPVWSLLPNVVSLPLYHTSMTYKTWRSKVNIVPPPLPPSGLLLFLVGILIIDYRKSFLNRLSIKRCSLIWRCQVLVELGILSLLMSLDLVKRGQWSEQLTIHESDCVWPVWNVQTDQTLWIANLFPSHLPCLYINTSVTFISVPHRGSIHKLVYTYSS